MTLETALTRACFTAGLALLCGACFAQGTAGPGMLGTLKANRILFLGNSITLHGIHEPYGWLIYCGMAASAVEKDYVHLTAAGIERHTGGHLRVSAKPSAAAAGAPAEPANIVNIADILERKYKEYSNAPLQPQLDWKPDIVVLQCGENVVREGFEPAAFKEALRSLLAALQAASAPQVFVTGQILGGGGALDEIKQQVCAEDPAHRVYVDLSSFGKDEANFARSEPYYKGIIVGHPGDKGMSVIAEALLAAMCKRGGIGEDEAQ